MRNDNVEVMRRPSVARGVDNVGAVLIAAAALWDLAGALLTESAAWPVVSYAAVGVGAAIVTIGVLMHMLMTPAARRARGRSAARLLAIGIVLLAWLLRGHPEIAPDAPIVGAEILAALALLFVRYR